MPTKPAWSIPYPDAGKAGLPFFVFTGKLPSSFAGVLPAEWVSTASPTWTPFTNP